MLILTLPKNGKKFGINYLNHILHELKIKIGIELGTIPNFLLRTAVN